MLIPRRYYDSPRIIVSLPSGLVRKFAHGTDQMGNRVELVQHTSQVSLLFTTVTLEAGSQGKRIGFNE